MNVVRLLCNSNVWLMTLATFVIADDAPSTPSPAVREALAHLADFRMTTSTGNRQDLPLSRTPLLTFGDAARANEAGTLWLWGTTGRPRALLELYRPTGDSKSWVHAITLTSTELVRLEAPEARNWTPDSSHFALSDLPDAGEVASRPVQRLRQMKELSRRFSAHEFWDPNNSRYELRLLVQPVCRYQDEAAGIADGAVFAFAHGTNPEVVLQIEATSAGRWKYGLVRLGSAEMHGELDGREVWTVPRTPGVVGRPIDPYWLFLIQPQTESLQIPKNAP